jgi:hypothetical protein
MTDYAYDNAGVWTPVTKGQVRTLFPDVSFPDEEFVTDATLLEFGVRPFVTATPPVITSLQRLEQGAITDVGGVLTRGWVVVDFTLQEIQDAILNHRAQLSDARRQKQRGNLQWTAPSTVVYTIFTDAESRARYAELVSAAREGIRQDGEDVRVGDATGEPIFISATNTVLRTIFTQTHAWFRRCEAAEKTALAQLKAAYQAQDYAAAMAVDYEAIFAVTP